MAKKVRTTQPKAPRATGERTTSAARDTADIIVSGAQIELERASAQHAMIAAAAYFRAERRGFEPGHELEDWLAAEAEVSGRRSSAA